MKHTLNNFKSSVREMDRDEQKKLLDDLRLTLMRERTIAEKGGGSLNLGLIRRQIAIVKTIMGEKGFHYNPR